MRRLKKIFEESIKKLDYKPHIGAISLKKANNQDYWFCGP